MVLEYCNIREVVTSLVTDISFDQRKLAVSNFNKVRFLRCRFLQMMKKRSTACMFNLMKNCQSVYNFQEI